MAVMASLYLAGFTTYSWSGADLEGRLIASPALVPRLLCRDRGGPLRPVAARKRELGVDDSLIYEDEPDPIVRSLELG